MPIKITIAGLNGAGGYYGALLAKHYTYDEEMNVCFLTRGLHLKGLQRVGLTTRFDKHGAFAAQPRLITDKPDKIGVSDYIILGSEVYCTEERIKLLKPCMSKTTVIVPISKDAGAVERVRALLPDNEVWEAHSEVEAEISDSGMLSANGSDKRLYIGAVKTSSKQPQFEKLLREAGIEVKIASIQLSINE